MGWALLDQLGIKEIAHRASCWRQFPDVELCAMSNGQVKLEGARSPEDSEQDGFSTGHRPGSFWAHCLASLYKGLVTSLYFGA